MPPNAPQERKGRTQADPQYFRYAGLGMQFALTFLAFGALGYWLDGKLGTTPWLLLIGIALGATGAFISLVRKVQPARDSARKGGSGGPNP